jgi:hypothetical protein
MLGKEWLESDVSWLLVYTKPHAEVWAEANLRNQGFMPLLPRVAARSGFAPLFKRYLFVGFRGLQPPPSIRNTSGVLYVVRCGQQVARVPAEVIADVSGRMNEYGIVHLAPKPATSPLFARRERERNAALAKFASAGFKLKSA